MAHGTAGLTPAHIQEAFVGAAMEVAHGDGDTDTGEDEHSLAGPVLRQVEVSHAHLSDSREPESLAEMHAPSRPGFGFRAE